MEPQIIIARRSARELSPGAEEVKKDVAFVKALQDKNKLSEQDALRCYCLLALNANEFVYPN